MYFGPKSVRFHVPTKKEDLSDASTRILAMCPHKFKWNSKHTKIRYRTVGVDGGKVDWSKRHASYRADFVQCCHCCLLLVRDARFPCIIVCVF